MSEFTSTREGFQRAMEWSLIQDPANKHDDTELYAKSTSTPSFHHIMNGQRIESEAYVKGIKEWRAKISDYKPVVHEFLRDGDQLAARMTGNIKVDSIETTFESFMFAKVDKESGKMEYLIERLCMCLFLTNLEIPIVTTALVDITSELGGFNKASWIISAYLLGYSGVLIILSKLSDIFGRKSILIIVILLFTIFSGACGAAQTIEQLSGIGGASNYALCSVILLELVPSHKYAKYTSSVSGVYSISLLLGPILGGAISEGTTWRWVFLLNRVWVGMMLNALFLGAPWFCAMFQHPQRLQIVNNLSPLQAGVRFIPFTLAAPFGSVFAPTVAKVGKVPPIYLVIFAAVLQVIGFALLSTLPSSETVMAAQYGYQIIAGFGCGINITLLILMTPFCVQERDKTVAMGSVAQFRVMGGAIGLAILTTAFNGFVRGRLSNTLTTEQLSQLLRYPESMSVLPSSAREAARLIFAEGYKLQIQILAGLAAGQIPASFLMWQKKQIKV
ncbi:hypothetical protein E8E14_007659 [Neopestalotiopsis sp. 37M]|nr:hypothetical protein E8E14_007659 [Neopestalotiopsis sp. 37M]